MQARRVAIALAAAASLGAGTLYAGEPGDEPAAADPYAADDAPLEGPVVPADCDAGKLFANVRGADITERIAAYDDFVRACRSSAAAATVYEESLLLRELLGRQIEELGEPPVAPPGAARPHPGRPGERPRPPGSNAPPPPAWTPVAPPPPNVPYEEPTSTHEGLFFRMAMGANYFKGNYTAGGAIYALMETDALYVQPEGSLTGPALNVEASLGYSFLPGLGLGLRVSALLVPSWSLEGGYLSSQPQSKPFGLATVGPVVSWFPMAEGIFHLWMSPGAGFTTIRDASGMLPEDALKGFVFSMGMGVEGLVGDMVGVGLEARLDAGYLKSSDAGGAQPTKLGFVTPGLALTVAVN